MLRYILRDVIFWSDCQGFWNTYLKWLCWNKKKITFKFKNVSKKRGMGCCHSFYNILFFVQERDEGSSTSSWQESYEKPKTSEKCYKKRKISLSSSSSSDSDSEREAQALEDTNALFEKLIQSNPDKNSKWGSASNLKKMVPPSTNSKGMVSPSNRQISPRGSPLKNSPDKCEGLHLNLYFI